MIDGTPEVRTRIRRLADRWYDISSEEEEFELEDELHATYHRDIVTQAGALYMRREHRNGGGR